MTQSLDLKAIARAMHARVQLLRRWSVVASANSTCRVWRLFRWNRWRPHLPRALQEHRFELAGIVKMRKMRKMVMQVMEVYASGSWSMA